MKAPGAVGSAGGVIGSGTRWLPTHYSIYLGLLERWSNEVEVTVPDVERLIFADSSANLAGDRRSSQWAESWVPHR